MQKVFIIISLFYISPSDKLDEAINKYLVSASSYQNIEKLYTILGKKLALYKNRFDYVPSFSPLNPTKTKRYSDKFGNRFHPIDGTLKKHLGVDLAAQYGTPVHATASGSIKLVEMSETGYGKQVVITHDYGFVTKYAHLHTIITHAGKKIKKGDIIGFVGSSGASTGSHLHYEIIKNNCHIDPYPFLFLYKFELN